MARRLTILNARVFHLFICWKPPMITGSIDQSSHRDAWLRPYPENWRCLLHLKPDLSQEKSRMQILYSMYKVPSIQTSALQNTMTKSLPESFDPFITHPFTNGSGLTPDRSALPPSHPAPFPSPHLRSYQPKTVSPKLYYPPFDSVPSPNSNPSSRYSTPVHSPTPRGPPLASPPPRQIFELFRKDAPTPEPVLKKKLPVKSKVVSRPK